MGNRKDFFTAMLAAFFIAACLVVIFALPAFDNGIWRVEADTGGLRKETVVESVTNAMCHNETTLHFGVTSISDGDIEEWMRSIPGLTAVSVETERSSGGWNVVATIQYWDSYPLIWAVENGCEEATLDKRQTRLLARYREVLSGILTDGMDDSEKELAIHDWLTAHMEYDERVVTGHPGWSMMTEGRGTCEGYAEAMYVMCRLAGLDVSIITGYAGGQSHVWLLIRLDGSLYHVDPTWDDNGEQSHCWYNLPDEEMAQDHEWVRDDYPTADGGTHEWTQEAVASQVALMKLVRERLSDDGDTVLEFVDDGTLDVGLAVGLLGEQRMYRDSTHERNGMVYHVVTILAGDVGQ